ncbi:N-acetylmuramoyl-L-alanine amidase [Streptomyces sp. WAC00469]|uniref:Peptidoglycan recognition protein n=1 Tax=Streptomyces thermoviolaceus subsp. thermoviolaceus TaxID=66860 RepID=A0ABX0YRX7_STRTL|nr:peptidoglycan recognition protein [Streptomyces thermoviolaceus subsp. thermoviolaceus]RSS08329.1 N-acetylmuramoyl-L-alanine amidase [Streptomyces sp. WAC00469]
MRAVRTDRTRQRSETVQRRPESVLSRAGSGLRRAGAAVRRAGAAALRRTGTDAGPHPTGTDAARSGDRRPGTAVIVVCRPPARTRHTVLVLLCCLPVAALVGGFAAGARGTGHVETVGRHGLPPAEAPRAAATMPALHRAPRPRIVRREAWLDASHRHRQPPPRYDDKVVAVFLHHTDTPNDYSCADTPRIIRGLYEGQTDGRHWDDIGYNFLVDRCGTVYEGRAGGVDRPVTGAHTQGFNHRTAGIAAIGTFDAGTPVPRAMTDAIAALVAWKLGLAGVDPRSSVVLVSSNGHSRYPAGTAALLPALAGHRDGFPTDCPGAALAARFPALRETAARLQGRF